MQTASLDETVGTMEDDDWFLGMTNLPLGFVLILGFAQALTYLYSRPGFRAQEHFLHEL